MRSGVVVYTPTLDDLLLTKKINKVPYSQRSGKWFPRVGDQYWNYGKDTMITVVSVDNKSSKVIIRWGLTDCYETMAIDNMPKANLVFKDWKFDLSVLDFDDRSRAIEGFCQIIKGGIAETSIKGAEIRALCAMRMIPYPYGSELLTNYIGNTADYKINDNVYYWIVVDRFGAKLGAKLERDLKKSPRKYENTTTKGEVSTEVGGNPIPAIAPDMFVGYNMYNLNDTIALNEINNPELGVSRMISRAHMFWSRVFGILPLPRRHI